MSTATTRRQFLGVALGSGALTAAGLTGASVLGFSLEKAEAATRQLKISRAREVHSVCPYCAVGCGMIAYVLGDGSRNTVPTIVHIEGNPDSPVSAGTLCPKGATTMQLTVNKRRVLAPLYRAPGATNWQEISWDDMLDRMAHRIKETRDRTFVTHDSQGRTVNRQEGFATVGGAAFSNEEGYLMVKLFRALGTVYIEQQARV
jgi:formate dehydrogenase major subunit